jgi:hypothetical protein
MGRHFSRDAYIPHFARYVHGLMSNGFYTRHLDVSDIELLERIRNHGSVSSGACYDGGSRSVHLAELDYWNRPYGVEEGIVRRLGEPKYAETREERAARQQALKDMRANSDWAKLRAQRAAERAEADAEMAREWERQREAQQQEREKRLLATMESDAEWDLAEEQQKAVRAEAERKAREARAEEANKPKFWEIWEEVEPGKIWRRKPPTPGALPKTATALERYRHQQRQRAERERAYYDRLMLGWRALQRNKGREKEARAIRRAIRAKQAQAERAKREALAAAKLECEQRERDSAPPPAAEAYEFHRSEVARIEREKAAAMARAEAQRTVAISLERERREREQGQLREQHEGQERREQAVLREQLAAQHEVVKRNISHLLQVYPFRTFMIREIMNAINCPDAKVVLECVKELAGTHELRSAYVVPLKDQKNA